ncbi:MAG: hypothetical protein WC758_02670 [Candidatus Woesearchaeota archaeon]
MQCIKCKKSTIIDVEYAGKRYCDTHFMELIEKRVRKHLRITQMIDVKKEYVLLDDSSSEAKIAMYLLNKIFNGYLKIKIVKMKPKMKGSNVILSTNLDEQALSFLNEFLKNKNKKVDDVKSNEIPRGEFNKKQIVPLEVLMQKEIEIICRILNVEFYPRVKSNILASLEKQHPEIMFSLFKSKENLK